MVVAVFFLSAIALAFAKDVDWFIGVKTSRTNTESLTQRACFRGTYGLEEISLFTCTFDGIDGKWFAQLPEDAPICVVEARDTEAARSIVTRAKDTSLIAELDNILILTSTNFIDYPSTCGSRSDYNGAALNVMRVPRQAIIPQEPFVPSPLAINPKIVGIVNLITQAKLKATVEKLTSYITRNSYSTNATAAGNDLQREWQSKGANATLQSFRTGMCSNVVGEILGTNRAVFTMIGGHLDSRASSTTNATQPAPGADDNGSGLAVVMELFRAINEYTPKVTFTNSIRFYAWCGEEQGLLGSDFAAKDSRSKGQVIESYLNVDMLGYKPATPVNSTLGFVERAVNLDFTNNMKALIREYYPNLPQTTTTVCCSDQQSYNTQGFVAGGLFEQGGTSVGYPQYHTASDTADRLNYPQLEAFGRAAAVVFLTRAGIL